MTDLYVLCLFTAWCCTKGKKYKVITEYDSVYEIQCDNGKIYCRNKNQFEIVNDGDNHDPQH